MASKDRPHVGYANKKSRTLWRRNYMRKYRAKLKSLGIKRDWNSHGYLARIRHQALNILGGPVCVECGCPVESILEINHVKGGGRKELLATGGYKKMIRRIIKGEFEPGEFNVTCRVCNAVHYVRDIKGVLGHKVMWNPPAQ